eukprot:9411137-Pyramimonas_sp.AAC.1
MPLRIGMGRLSGQSACDAPSCRAARTPLTAHLGPRCQMGALAWECMWLARRSCCQRCTPCTENGRRSAGHTRH